MRLPAKIYLFVLVAIFAARSVSAEPQNEKVYRLMKKAAAYPVTDVSACIAGVDFAASLYADLLRQGALQSDEYIKHSIETQLGFALENGTRVDMQAFSIMFDIERTNNSSWEEVAGNDGRDYAAITALFELITCKFGSGVAGIKGPIQKDVAIKLVNKMIEDERRSDK